MSSKEESEGESRRNRRATTKPLITKETSELKLVQNNRRPQRTKRSLTTKPVEPELGNKLSSTKRRKTIDLKNAKIPRDSPLVSIPNQDPEPTLVVPPDQLSIAMLELLIQKQTIINEYFDVAERMLFRPPTCRCGFDELFYSWIVQDRFPPYRDAFTEEERRTRKVALKAAATTKRRNLAIAMEKLSSKKLLEPQIISHSSLKSQQDAPYSLEKGEEKALPSEAAKIQKWITDWIESDKSSLKLEKHECDQLVYLRSDLINVTCIADWTPREIALFEVALCQYGQNFQDISKSIGSKSFKQCYNFYSEIFKQSNRYLAFKEHKKLALWYG